MRPQRGFIAPLLLALVAILLLGSGAYVYMHTRAETSGDALRSISTNPPTISTSTDSVGSDLCAAVQSGSLSVGVSASTDGIGTIKYDQANPEQKCLLDRVLADNNFWFKKDKMVLFYFDLTKNVAVVGMATTPDSLLVGFFHPVTSGGPAVAPQPFKQGGLIGVECKNASSFSASCIYVTKRYLVLFGGDDISSKAIFAYKAGDVSYDASLQKNSWGSYVKGYDSNYVPTLDTSFDGRTITASVYKDNQYIGMGEFDLTKKNEYFRTVTFELK